MTYLDWVRFDTELPAGVEKKIPESCVAPNHCGTFTPVWFSGTHPTGYKIRLVYY